MMSELPPEAVFMADPDLLLVDGYQVNLALGGMLGKNADFREPFFAVRIDGRVNKSEERRTVNLLLPVEFGYKLGDEIMTRMEQFAQMMKEREGS